MASSKTMEKPTAAFVLTLIGGIIILIAGLVSIVVGLLIGFMHVSFLLVASGLVGTACGVLVTLSSVLMHTTKSSVRSKWSIIALVFAVVSLFNLGGFLAGFILALVGSIIGLVHK